MAASSAMALAKIMMTMIMLILLTPTTIATAKTTTTLTSGSNEANYNELLSTETAIIDTLREYISKLEDNITVIKRKTLEIKISHDEALEDVEKYVSNPYNALTILKRFATDWHAIHKLANSVLNNTHEISKDINAAKESFKFPSEDEFDEAVANLLRLQDIYKLEPKRLSLGEIDGIKFGSEMSWSDCLEIARKSDDNGDYKVAKFWSEAAMDKLPQTEVTMKNNETNFENNEKVEGVFSEARFEILQALLNAEYHMDNFEAALQIADEMAALKPQHKGVLKAKATIEKTLKKETKKAKNKRLKKSQKDMAKQKDTGKTAEAALIEEICRESTILTTNSRNAEALRSNTKIKCFLEHGNLKSLLLQPVQIEILSLDPYIAVQHGVLSKKQVDDLKNLIEEKFDETNNVKDNDEGLEIDDLPANYEFTKLAKQKLRRLNEQLERQTGHLRFNFDDWQPHWHSFDNDALQMEIETTSTLTTMKQKNIIANVMLSLELAKLGGSIVFPQLELSLRVPPGALLYWTNLNEFDEVDYRIKHHICPVIAGTQITAVNTIRRQ